MLRIEMLPAGYGDCLWIEYGDERSPHRILIDGGVAGTHAAILRRIAACGSACHVELVIISHVDADHIEGVMKLLDHPPSGFTVGDVWFNGWRHLPAPSHATLGAVEGEKLSEILTSRHLPWNTGFSGKAVVVPDSGTLPQVRLPGDMNLTLLSPSREQLRALRPVWKKACEQAGLVPGKPARRGAAGKGEKPAGRRLGGGIDIRELAEEPYEPDDSQTNGSSIAVLAEFDGKRCLLAADALSEVLVSSLGRLRKKGVDAYKMSHHGSRYNNSPDLLDAVPCRHYLVSTNGKRFGHPDPQTIARVLTAGKGESTLYFNYRSEQTRGWEDPDPQEQFHYRARYPETTPGGLCVDI